MIQLTDKVLIFVSVTQEEKLSQHINIPKTKTWDLSFQGPFLLDKKVEILI
jgi:hypothetical protein